MTLEQLKERIESLGPGTRAEVRDLTGTQNHFEALIVSPAFEGKKLMDQHRLIYALVDAEMKSNEVHALAMKTMTPEEYEKKRGS